MNVIMFTYIKIWCMSANVANQKEFFGEGFKGDKTFLLIILLPKWNYQLVIE